MMDQNEAIILCPLPVILLMRVADQNGKEEVKRKIFFASNTSAYEEVIRVKMWPSCVL